MGFVGTSIHFPAVQKFWKSVKIWQSYREFKGGNFFVIQCSFINIRDCCTLHLLGNDTEPNGHKMCQGMFCIPVLHACRPVITLLHYSHNFDCIWFGCISIVHWFAILHCNCNHDHLAASTKAQTQLSIVRQSLLETKLITVTAYYLFYYTACIC